MFAAYYGDSYRRQDNLPVQTSLLGKAAGVRLVKTFPACYRTTRCIIQNSSPALIQRQTNPKSSLRTSSWRSILISSSYPCQGITRGFFPSQLPTKAILRFYPVPWQSHGPLLWMDIRKCWGIVGDGVFENCNERRNDTERSNQKTGPLVLVWSLKIPPAAGGKLHYPLAYRINPLTPNDL
jgi:hypothetical protein